MNIKELLAAKRAAEICKENKQPISNLNIVAALKQVAREFSKEQKHD
jgi:hypothetical protein